jgi:hypothetical protein
MQWGTEIMSNQVLIILLVAVLVFTFFGVMWVMKVANQQREAIIMGVHRGVPISIKHRRLMLSNDWAGFKCFSVACC